MLPVDWCPKNNLSQIIPIPIHGRSSGHYIYQVVWIENVFFLLFSNNRNDHPGIPKVTHKFKNVYADCRISLSTWTDFVSKNWDKSIHTNDGCQTPCKLFWFLSQMVASNDVRVITIQQVQEELSTQLSALFNLWTLRSDNPFPVAIHRSQSKTQIQFGESMSLSYWTMVVIVNLPMVKAMIKLIHPSILSNHAIGKV